MSDKIDDGGPAFPGVDRTAVGGAPVWEGASLRDYFASAALQGLLHNPNTDNFSNEKIASAVYAVADAMIKERAKHGAD